MFLGRPTTYYVEKKNKNSKSHGQVDLSWNASYIFLRDLLHVDEHCRGAKLVGYEDWRTLSTFFDAWFSFINCCLQRTAVIDLPSFSNSWYLLYLLDPTKYITSPFEHEYCILTLMDLVHPCLLSFGDKFRQHFFLKLKQKLQSFPHMLFCSFKT